MTKILKNQMSNRFIKFIFICFLITTTINSNSQSLKTFADENTTYTYYIDSISGEKIKHGNFKSIEKKDTYSRIVTGNFNKGLPNGIYTVEEKAVKNKHYYPNEYSETGFSKAVINLKNGVPNGIWTYTKSWTINDLVVNYAKREPGKETISLSMEFNNGRPCGTFDLYYESNSVYEILIKANPFNLTNYDWCEANLKGKTLGQFNKNGFAVGKWTFDNSKILANFNNGVLIDVLEKFASTSGKYIDKKQDDELKSLSIKYSNNEISIKDLKQKLVKIDTVYMFNNSSFDFFNTDNDDFGRFIILSRFKKPNIADLLNIQNDGSSNKSTKELALLFEEWGFIFSPEDERIYSQLVLTAKENEEQERIKKKKEEIRLKEIEEQKLKALIIEKQNIISFEKYKLLQTKFQEIKELPTINISFINGSPLFNNSGNFEIYHNFLYNFTCNNINKLRELGENLGKISFDQFKPTYNYSSYISVPYSLDSIYSIDSLRMKKINEVYLPQSEYIRTLLKQYNEISQLLEQIDLKLFDPSNINKEAKLPDLYNALVEILNNNMENLTSESISLKSKVEDISKINMILGKSLTIQRESNKKLRNALKETSTTEEKKQVILSF